MTGPRVAYLVSKYPAVSHAFIEREVTALRHQGVSIHTFSIRPADAEDARGDTGRAAAATTFVVKDTRQAAHWMRAHLSLLLRAPSAYIRTLAAAGRIGAPGPRYRLWQLFYWAEGVVLLREMRRARLNHLHVHFANNGADVARQLVRVAAAAYPSEGPWSWSMSMHGPTEFFDPQGYDLAAKAADASFVACISRWCEREIRTLAPTARTMIVHMGVDLGRYPLAHREREQEPLRVLFAGRLVWEKNPADLVAASAGLDSVELVLAGDGPLRAALEQQAGEGVLFLGAVSQDELPAWYGWADVLCLPSQAEGLPVVLMEAMATGLPVITTPISGIPELVVDGENGLFVSPGDVQGIAVALERLRNSELRSRLGCAGRAAVEDGFDSERAVLPLLSAFRTLPTRRVSTGSRRR